MCQVKKENKREEKKNSGNWHRGEDRQSRQSIISFICPLSEYT